MSDLHEIMSRDPRGYTKQDLDTIIRVLRERRHQFNLGNAKAGSTKPLSAKDKATLELAKQLDLKALDL